MVEVPAAGIVGGTVILVVRRGADEVAALMVLGACSFVAREGRAVVVFVVFLGDIVDREVNKRCCRYEGC